MDVIENKKIYIFDEFRKELDYKYDLVYNLLLSFMVLFLPLFFLRIHNNIKNQAEILFYMSLTLFVLYIIAIVYYYNLTNLDFSMIKEKMDKEIDKKLLYNCLCIKSRESYSDKYKFFRERKIDFINICIDEVNLPMKYCLDIFVGLFIAFLISMSGLAYGYIDTLATEEIVIAEETIESFETKPLNNSMISAYGYKDSMKQGLVFSLASHVVISAITLIFSFIMAFFHIDSRYYYIKILQSIKKDVIIIYKEYN